MTGLLANAAVGGVCILLWRGKPIVVVPTLGRALDRFDAWSDRW